MVNDEKCFHANSATNQTLRQEGAIVIGHC
jgi:hypothetical protein